MRANDVYRKIYEKASVIYPRSFREKYGREMLNVFSQELTEQNGSWIFFVRSIMNVVRAALIQQRCVLVGIAALSLGLITTYDQLLHAWDERSLQTGVVTGMALLLTSIGLLRQKTWTIYPWAMSVLVIIDLIVQSTYWGLAILIKPFCVATTETIAVQGCGVGQPDIWVILGMISVAIPAYVTYLVTKLILSERTRILALGK